MAPPSRPVDSRLKILKAEVRRGEEARARLHSLAQGGIQSLEDFHEQEMRRRSSLDLSSTSSTAPPAADSVGHGASTAAASALPRVIGVTDFKLPTGKGRRQSGPEAARGGGGGVQGRVSPASLVQPVKVNSNFSIRRTGPGDTDPPGLCSSRPMIIVDVKGSRAGDEEEEEEEEEEYGEDDFDDDSFEEEDDDEEEGRGRQQRAAEDQKQQQLQAGWQQEGCRQRQQQQQQQEEEDEEEEDLSPYLRPDDGDGRGSHPPAPHPAAWPEASGPLPSSTSPSSSSYDASSLLLPPSWSASAPTRSDGAAAASARACAARDTHAAEGGLRPPQQSEDEAFWNILRACQQQQQQQQDEAGQCRGDSSHPECDYDGDDSPILDVGGGEGTAGGEDPFDWLPLSDDNGGCRQGRESEGPCCLCGGWRDGGDRRERERREAARERHERREEEQDEERERQLSSWLKELREVMGGFTQEASELLDQHRRLAGRGITDLPADQILVDLIN